MKKFRFSSAFLLLAVALSPAPALAETRLFDPFTDGGAANGADALDALWVPGPGVGAAGTVSVIADSILPARGEANSNVLQWTPGATFQGLSATFAPSYVLAVGDSIQLTLDFRYVATPGSGGFRFGLYNDPGTPANDNDNFGYYVNVGTGGVTPANSVWRESGGTGGVAAGGDRAQIGATTSLPTGITGTEAHTLSLTLTRIAAGSISIAAEIDGSTVANVTDAAATNFSYSAVAIGDAGNNQAINIDNVTVVVVPEPSSFALLAAALLPFARRRRQRAR